MKRVVGKLSRQLKKLNKSVSKSKGIILMYHRICSGYPDPWKLNVSEINFRDHIRLFNENYNVLPLYEFNKLRKNGRLPNRALAITFDDGYADNALLAAPIMHEAKIPATFFICTGTLGRESGMWWDDLAQVVFCKNSLPEIEKQEYDTKVKVLFYKNTSHYDRNNSSITRRLIQDVEKMSMDTLYMHLWNEMRSLSVDQQQSKIKQYIRRLNIEVVSMYPMMQSSDLIQLSESSLFEIGAHTHNHVQLPEHDAIIQRLEIQENLEHLEQLTGQHIKSVSYPFGSYSRDTLTIAKQVGFESACTTAPEIAARIDDTLLLPRLTVYDVSAMSLQANLDSYF